MKGYAELPTGEPNAEARRLITIIKSSDKFRALPEHDRDFVNGLDPEARTVTRKMLFWLRDIRDRCLP